MTTILPDTLRQQLAFLAELDLLKSVVRQSILINRSRRENAAEHSRHLALFALVLAQPADAVDPLQVARLLLLHDIVEIDAGDAPIHAAGTDKHLLAQAEHAAARRIFALVAAPQGREFLALREEFEAGQTPNARFARALDRLQPLLLNILTDGGTWTENGVTEQQVQERYGPAIQAGSPELWQAAESLVRDHFKERAERAARN